MSVRSHSAAPRADATQVFPALSREPDPDGAAVGTPGSGEHGAGGTIRRRVVRTLTLPVVAVLLLLGVITVIEVDNYRSADASARSVTLVLAVQDLVQELQTERGLTAGLLGGNVGFRPELAPARKRVDDQRTKLDTLTEDGDDVQDRVRAALRRLDGLAGVRAGTDSGASKREAAFDFYTARIGDLGGVDFELDGAADADLRRGVAALDALSAAKESTAQERAFLNGVFSAGGFNGGEFLQFVTMRAAKDAALTSFGRYATGTQRTSKDYVFDTGAARVATYFEQVALAAGDGRNLQVNPQAWWSALTTVLDDMLRLQQHVGSVIQARASTLQDQAARRMGLLVGAVVLCFLGSVYLATVASRSISMPLATLAREANQLASERLPAAVQRVTTGAGDDPPAKVRVPVRASDEVRSVADALDRVQATAYALATEQALLRRSTTESLANLGRRNQNLLRRQLGFITSLEREEADPAGLANLFELDHLATRMRRNAESLLVLVGAASPRQWSAPLPVSDVIRAAVSEVEEYRRVTLRRVDDAFVAGAVVSGVAHMLAELIENGLTFSPPDVDVEIQGRVIGDSYLIAITDQGIGMSQDDLGRANARLRGEGDFVAAPTRFLGHYVVGQLATEMAIDVQLAPSPVTGVTARVVLPPAVLASAPAIAGPVEMVRPTDGQAVPGHRRALEPAGTGPADDRIPYEPPAPVQPSSYPPRPAFAEPPAATRSPAFAETPAFAESPAFAETPAAEPSYAEPAYVEHTYAEADAAEPVFAEPVFAEPAIVAAPDPEPVSGQPVVPYPAMDPAATQRIELQPEAGARAGRRIRPTTIDYVTIADGAAVPRQRVGEPAQVTGASTPWHEATQAHPVLAMQGREGFDMPSPGGDDAEERTPNGLRRRNTRARKSVPATPARPGDARPVERPAPLDDSANEVRARLTALRAGMQRGRAEQPPSTATMSPRTGSEVERSSHER